MTYTLLETAFNTVQQYDIPKKRIFLNYSNVFDVILTVHRR